MQKSDKFTWLFMGAFYAFSFTANWFATSGHVKQQRSVASKVDITPYYDSSFKY